MTGQTRIDKKARVWAALDGLRIELPSWGFSNTGTRFGKFLQPGAACTIAEKFADAAEVNRLTGASPLLGLHVLWDLPNGLSDVSAIQELESKEGVRAASINPNLFQLQEYKHGSIASPDPAVRARALEHIIESVQIGRALGSHDVSLWVPDGSNYPGTQSIRKRIIWMEEVLCQVHAALGEDQRLLLEYKPFEPAFYHTDIADWGMALELTRRTGPKAKVLIDTGHHYQSVNIEQIVAWLLHLGAIGGFHFNDRKYADDDLTLGSIDPYQVFRIFHEILSAPKAETGNIAFMVDQSHNLKPKMQAMVQTVMIAQDLYAKAAIVDREYLAELQQDCRLVEAEECFRSAFWEDVRPLVREWRGARGLAENPLEALQASGYLERIESERGSANAKIAANYA